MNVYFCILRLQVDHTDSMRQSVAGFLISVSLSFIAIGYQQIWLPEGLKSTAEVILLCCAWTLPNFTSANDLDVQLNSLPPTSQQLISWSEADHCAWWRPILQSRHPCREKCTPPTSWWGVSSVKSKSARGTCKLQLLLQVETQHVGLPLDFQGGGPPRPSQPNFTAKSWRPQDIRVAWTHTLIIGDTCIVIF